MNLNISGRIDIHHHVDGGDLAKSVDRLGVILMALSQDLKDLVAQIDTATNQVASRIDALTAKITNSLSDSEVADIKAGLKAEVDKLTALGANPANPVPTP